MRTNKSYKDIVIWQKAQQVFEMVCKDIKKWPRSPITNSIAYQLIDSAGSISSNIAEGYGRGGPREFEQFFRYSRGSCAETDNWLYKSLQQNLITSSRYKEYVSLFDELYKMSASFINRLRQQKTR